MLRRRSLKTKSDLERRKSTSSAHASGGAGGGGGVVLEHIDPDLALRDAQIAACEAYARAQCRVVAEEVSVFPPPGVMSMTSMTPESAALRRRGSERMGGHGRSERRGGNGDVVCMLGVGDGDEVEGVQGLGHRQSVRFVGPCSVKVGSRRRKEGRDGSGSNEADLEDEEDHRISGLRSADSNAEAPSPPKRAPPPVPLPSLAAGHIAALAAEEEYYTPEDDIASAPSSYRRLHRSKSLRTNTRGGRPSHESSGPFLYTKSPRTRPPLPLDSRRLFRSDPNDSTTPPDHPALRAPKSMSFLNNRNSHFRSSTSQDGGIKHARTPGLPGLPEDGFQENGQSGSQLKYKTHTFFGSRSRRTGSKLRESLRSSSPVENHDSSTHDHPEEHSDTHGTLKSRARKASKSLKFKLKNLFTHARPEEEASIPCQHIEAQRTHVTEGFTSFHGSNTGHEVSTEDNYESIHRVPAKVPSFQFAPPGLVHSNKASLENLRDEGERKVSDTSSLTSWAHSGPSTLTSEQQRQWREWERQRLSVIRESGAHAPSPSMWRQPLGTGLFERPENTGDAAVHRPIVDSQRVYSALMKRMRAMNSRDTESDEQQSSTFKNNHTAQALDGRSPNRTPDTIRHVTIGRKHSTPSDTVITPTRASKRAGSTRSRLSQSASGLGGDCYYQNALEKFARDGRGIPSPTYTESSAAAVARSDTQSRAFGSPASHTFRTSSPYRRALRKSMLEEQNAWAQQSSGTEQDSDTGTQLHHAPAANSLRDTDSDSVSESVYSTDCNPEHEKAPGTDNRPTDRDTPIPYRADGYRRSSTVSSIDWKTWLSANIGKFDPNTSPSKQSDGSPQCVMPPSLPGRHFARGGHVREPAQIHGDDEDDNCRHVDDVFNPSSAASHEPNPGLRLPTTPLREVEHNVIAKSSSPALRRSAKRISAVNSSTYGNSPSSARNSLLVENEAPGATSQTLPAPPPPIPARSKLRPEPLRVSRGGNSRGNGVGRYGSSGFGGAGSESGYGGGGGGDSGSIMSSPGLTEAVRRQFGDLDGTVLGGSRGGYGRGRGRGEEEEGSPAFI